ncbi:TRAP-type mannitol/chloroaromatic compound transport system permease small subunit [Aliiruegeria haliotis]|uniref:TRAP transporter small permease protein n=1 Tax=Aliiruegeria haliotis TaxID=1280846 RepID=A0A2T0RW98_9RHOB|nr:TRAP transporter small permease [Aliiruegeria haliotis]PRY25466.1 TRAP-type mannitol/chloroaromatic compound transport system permease small subunit [Aliiruegeria haliotis]
MAGASSVLTDDSALSRTDRALFRLETFLALIGGIAIFGLMILAVINVAGRNGFNRPLAGYVDWIEQFMPIIATIGVAYVMRLGGHIRMDILVSQLSGRALWLFEAISTLCMLLVTLLLVWGSWAHFQRSFDMAMPMWSRDSSIDIGLPIWPAKLIVPVALSVLALRLLLQLYSFTRAFLRGDERPVAVPLIEDAATQAAHEAEHVSGMEDDR